MQILYDNIIIVTQQYHLYRAFSISIYVYVGNQGAFEILLKYYLSLGPAENLEDVYLRKDIIDMLSRYESDRRVIEAYVNELAICCG